MGRVLRAWGCPVPCLCRQPGLALGPATSASSQNPDKHLLVFPGLLILGALSCPVPRSSAHSSWQEWPGHWREAGRSAWHPNEARPWPCPLPTPAICCLLFQLCSSPDSQRDHRLSLSLRGDLSLAWASHDTGGGQNIPLSSWPHRENAEEFRAELWARVERDPSRRTSQRNKGVLRLLGSVPRPHVAPPQFIIDLMSPLSQFVLPVC